MAEGNRVRGQKPKNRTSGARDPVAFTNPYPWMGASEAMVKLALEEHQVPFSWRFFDGDAPTFTQLLVNTGYQPEFTLREYRVVILVTTSFWGLLPGVLDRAALAQVTLEADGWTVVNLFDTDIRTKGAWNTLSAAVPTLGSITGVERPNPYGRPNLLSGIHRGHRDINPQLQEHKKKHGRRIRRGATRTGDSGRRRIGQSGSVTSRLKAR